MSNGFLKPLLRSLLFSYIATAILLSALAFGLYNLRLRPAQVSAAVNIIYALTCFFGGFLAGKALRQRRFFWGFLLGALYFAVLFAASFLLGKGLPMDTGQLLRTFIMCAASGTIGGMLS